MKLNYYKKLNFMKSMKMTLAMALMLVFCHGLSSCGPDQTTIVKKSNVASPPLSPKPGEEQEEFESPIVYSWYYKQDIGKDDPLNSLPRCPKEFELDGVCDQPLESCVRGNSLYACYPKDLEIRITGKVIDEKGQPLRGAQIYSMYPMGVIGEQWRAESKKSGKFTVKVRNGCVPLLSVSKDGYVSMVDWAHDLRASRCRVDNFEGAKDLVFQLKKAPRTIEEEFIPVSTSTECHIKGRVLNANGQPLADVNVVNGNGSTVTDQEGVYEIKKSEVCERFCQARKRGFRAFGTDHSIALVSCFEAAPADVIMLENP